jgi:hypothetical protein
MRTTMKTINKFSAFVICLLFAGACTYDFPEFQEEPTQGEADFTKMISVGNALTAGFMNGALYTASQDNSFVATLAAQMELVGGGATFNQPTVNSDNGCFNPAGGCTQGRLYLKISGSSAVPTPKAGDGGASLAPLTVGDRAALNNFGVPSVTLGGSLSAALSANPYYNRIASNAGTSTLMGDAATALANGGTFFTFWLGIDDVLGYATAGASGSSLTSNGDFTTYFNLALNAMLGANPDAMGAVGNVLDVTLVPYFTTVPYNPVTLVQAQVDGLNPAFAAYNGGLDAAFGGGAISAAERDARKIIFVVGKNPVTIVDEKLTDLSGLGLPNYRFATASDLVVLPAASFIGTLVGGNPTLINGISVPLADQWIVGGLDGPWVLTSTEKEEIQNAVTAFNTTIAAAVTANSDRLVLVDAYATLTLLKTTSVTINGSAITASLSPPNGAFSVDGIHYNARGSAYMTNEFIKAINAKFGSNIPLCNPNAFTGNELPVP